MNRRRLAFAFALLLAVSLLLPACDRNGETPPTASGDGQDRTVVLQAEYAAVLEDAKANGVEVERGLYITRLFAYTGSFPEDTDEKEVKNAAAVTLVNLSPLAYRGLEFTVQCGNTGYRFFVSALPVGGRLTAVEQSGAPLTETDAPAVTVTYAEPYADNLSVHADKLRITYTDGSLTAENKTAETLENVCVYYKRTDENGYLGGLTYRVRLGAIPAGKTITSAAKFLSPGKSKVVFASINESEGTE